MIKSIVEQVEENRIIIDALVKHNSELINDNKELIEENESLRDKVISLEQYAPKKKVAELIKPVWTGRIDEEPIKPIPTRWGI